MLYKLTLATCAPSLPVCIDIRGRARLLATNRAETSSDCLVIKEKLHNTLTPQGFHNPLLNAHNCAKW